MLEPVLKLEPRYQSVSISGSNCSKMPGSGLGPQCLKTQKEDEKIADGWNVDFLYYYDIF